MQADFHRKGMEERAAAGMHVPDTDGFVSNAAVCNRRGGRIPIHRRSDVGMAELARGIWARSGCTLQVFVPIGGRFESGYPRRRRGGMYPGCRPPARPDHGEGRVYGRCSNFNDFGWLQCLSSQLDAWSAGNDKRF